MRRCTAEARCPTAGAALSSRAPQPAVEVWSRGSRGRRRQPDALAALLTAVEQQQLRQLCGRVLYHTLSSSVRVYGAGAHHAFVATGDIPDEWIRDMSVQQRATGRVPAAHCGAPIAACARWDLLVRDTERAAAAGLLGLRPGWCVAGCDDPVPLVHHAGDRRRHQAAGGLHPGRPLGQQLQGDLCPGEAAPPVGETHRRAGRGGGIHVPIALAAGCTHPQQSV
jgi:hypothetical protein